MAILAYFPGLTVQILVNGAPLQEYTGPAAIPQGIISQKYIEARTNQPFKVRVTYTAPFPTSHAVSLTISCDGAALGKTVQSGTDLYKASGHTYSGVPVKRGSSALLQPFIFPALETTEMLNTQLTSGVEEVGVITIAFAFAERIGHVASARKNSLQTPTRVPETAMKGDEKSHAVGLGPVEEARSPTEFVELEEVGVPFARFHFVYQSREVLCRMGIVEGEGVLGLDLRRESAVQASQDRLDGNDVLAPDLSRESTFQPSPDTVDNNTLMDELCEGDAYRKRKAEDVSNKQEPDAVPQRTERRSGRYWLVDEEAGRSVGTVEQRVDVVPRNTAYGRLLKEADDEEREALAKGLKYPGKKQRR